MALLGLTGVHAAPAIRAAVAPPGPTKAGSIDKADAAAALGKLPLRFEANVGQADPAARFIARSAGGTLFLTGKEAVLSPAPAAKSDVAPQAASGVVRMRPLDANPDVRPVGADPLPGVTNYLTGSDPSTWKTNVPSYGAVRYPGVYPGVDLVFHGKRDALEYDYVVAPGADPTTIAVGFDAPGEVVLEANGGLLLRNPGGDVRQSKPYLYQDIDGTRRQVPGSFVLEGPDRVGFDVGAYDPTHPLVIDPIIEFTTFLGELPTGLAVDSAGFVFLSGSTSSASFPLVGPQVGPPPSEGTSGLFVSKLTPDGKSLVYSTFLAGGCGCLNQAYSHSNLPAGGGLAVDAAGSAVVIGNDATASFPTTANAYRPNCGDSCNAPFVTKLAPNGASLTYSTFLSGQGTDNIAGVAVDAEGIYVIGRTLSRDYPTTAGGFDRICGTDGTCNNPTSFTDGVIGANPDNPNTLFSATARFTESDIDRTITGDNIPAGTTIAKLESCNCIRGNEIALSQPASGPGTNLNFTISGRSPTTNDAFLARIDPRLSGTASLAYSTFLGGSSIESGNGVAIDPSDPGTVYVGGTTSSGDFPVLAGIDGACGGQVTPGAECDSQDAFAAKVDTMATGAASLRWSTFLGGSGQEGGGLVAADTSGVYVGGSTRSADFPVRNAFQGVLNGTWDVFATKIRSDGSAIVYSTFLGGDAGDFFQTNDTLASIAVDPSGSVHLAGIAGSGFPQAGGQVQLAPIGFGLFEQFAARLTPSGSGLEHSTLYSVENGVTAALVATDAAGSTYVAGDRVDGFLEGSFGAADRRAFVLKLVPGIMPVVGALSPTGAPVGGGTSVVIAGAGFTGATAVTFGGAAATSFTVDSDTRIRAVTPPRPAGVELGESVYVAVTTPASTSLNVEEGRFFYGSGLATGYCVEGSCPGGPTLLANGKVLYTNGPASQLYNPATGAWRFTGSCAACGVDGTAVLLADGKVLWTGGSERDNFRAATERSYLYDPATEIWSATRNSSEIVTTMSGPRISHTATLLPSGKVLIAGGRVSNDNSLVPARETAELYDPSTGTFTATGSMSVARTYHTATFIDPARGGCGSNCGKVLVAFGRQPGNTVESTNTAELYDPAAGTWGGTTTAATGGISPAAVQLRDGKVVVLGGGNVTSVNSRNARDTTDVYDPAAGLNGAWAPGAPLNTPRSQGPAAVLLPNGGVLVTGGEDGFGLGEEAVAEIRDPATGRWTNTAILPHAGGSSVLLPLGPVSVCATRCGTVLVVDRNSAETYAPAPQVTGLSVTSGPSGTAVTITGTGLASTFGVRFGDTNAASFTPDPLTPDSKLVAMAPPHAAGPVGVVVSNPSGASTPVTFTFVAPNPTFSPLSPARIWDSRFGPGPTGQVGAGQTREITVTGVGGVPATGVTAVVLNVTAVGPSAPTFVTAWPTGEAKPLASNLNVPPGDARPNLVIVKVGADGKVSFNNAAGNVDLIADVAGWYGPSGGQRYTAVSPARLWDSRFGPGPMGQVGADQTREITVTGVGGVPATGVSAVVLNVTAVGPSAPTFVTAWPTGEAKPLASNLNVPPGDVRPNLVIVKVGTGGKVSFNNAAGNLDLVADVAGYYGATGSSFTSVSPSRVWDSRFGPGPTGQVGAGQTREITVTGVGGVPATGVTAVVLNVTAVGPSASTFVTAWPTGEAKPLASNLNVPPGDVRPNLVIVKVGADGKVSFNNAAGNVDLIADVAGWYGPPGA